jgi:excisionase family DNA binding protein
MSIQIELGIQEKEIPEMNALHQPNSRSTYELISDQEKAVIRERSDRAGKQLGEAAANLLYELILAIISTKGQTKAEKQNAILTADEVAKVLRISKSKVYRMMQLGEIPSLKFGRTSRVRLEDLQDFIRNQGK